MMPARSAQWFTTLPAGKNRLIRSLSVLVFSAIASVIFAGAFATPAYAWDVSWSRPDVLMVERSAEDTGSQLVQVYVSTSPETYSWSNTGLWDDASWVTLTQNALNADQYACEITIPPGYKRVYALCVKGTVYQRRYYLTRGVDQVAVVSMPAVNTTVTAMPDVSLASSISVDGTLPVEVSSVGGIDSSDVLSLFGWLMGLFAGVVTAIVWKRT